MSPLPTNGISHFLHPAHKLCNLTTNTSYLCDGCKLPGTGSRFNCTSCDFDLHDYCAKCPTRLTSNTSHQHPMSLVVHKPTPNLTDSCQICLNPVNGLAYLCKDCDFWVHPVCVSTNSGHSQNLSVPTNSGHNQNRAIPSGPAPTAAPAAQGIAGQVGIGLATNAISDGIKWGLTEDEDPSVGSDQVPLVGSGEDDGGFFDAIKSGFKSIFESVSDS